MIATPPANSPVRPWSSHDQGWTTPWHISSQKCHGTAREKTTLLTDEQWVEIVRHSGLPPEAKPSVIQVIDIYRSNQASYDNRNKPARVRDELDDLRKDAEALAKSLANGLNDIDFWSAIFLSRCPSTGWVPRTGPVAEAVAIQRFLGTFHELQRLVDWLTLARDRIPRGKPGSKRQSRPASVAADDLDQILMEFTGKNLERSNKRNDTTRYAKAVLRIADPDIGDGTIDEAIKHQIQYRKARGEIAPKSTRVIAPPISRDKGRSARKIAKSSHRKE